MKLVQDNLFQVQWDEPSAALPHKISPWDIIPKPSQMSKESCWCFYMDDKDYLVRG